MIDYFALALTHGLILLALIRIAGRAELDREPGADEKSKTRGDDAAPEVPRDA